MNHAAEPWWDGLVQGEKGVHSMPAARCRSPNVRAHVRYLGLEAGCRCRHERGCAAGGAGEVHLVKAHGADGRGSRGEVAEPPREGIPLGWRLGLATGLIVTMVMGPMTFLQHWYEIRSERQAREALLRMSLAPLIAEIRPGDTRGDVSAAVLRFHRAYLRSARPDHQLELRDALGRTVVSSFPEGRKPSAPTFRASALLVSRALDGGSGTIRVWEDASEFEAMVKRRWELWWLHMGVTVGSVLVFILLGVRFLVIRPLLALRDGVRKMEMGYWGDLRVPGGAWEIRWLAWRFRDMGLELQKTVRQLVAAERRAAESMQSHCSVAPSSRRAEDDAERSGPGPRPVSAYLKLRGGVLPLESMVAGDPSAERAASEAWEHDGAEADRLGEWKLETRPGDASLRILEPTAFSDLENALTASKRSLWSEIRRSEATLRRELEKQGVSFVHVQHRLKHIAGVWKKMQAKGLTADQIHDLLALRILVPTEADCYAALGVVHRTFDPVVGRFKDYIAAPKANGYQSLHSCVRSDRGTIFEVQIRSVEMHSQAEQGSAAHWSYKVAQLSLASVMRPSRRRWWWWPARLTDKWWKR